MYIMYMYVTCILHVSHMYKLHVHYVHVYYMYTVPVSIFDVRLHWVQLFFETPGHKIQNVNM